MSADPVTLAVISGAMSAVSGYAQIQSAKAEGKAQRAQYERQRKLNELNAIQEENRRKKQADEDRANNAAIFASTGFDPDSRSFLTVQNEVDRIAKKDIANIRINALSTTADLQTASYISSVKEKSKVVGGYASIIKGTTEAYGKYELYKSSTTKGDYAYNKELAKIRSDTF